MPPQRLLDHARNEGQDSSFAVLEVRQPMLSGDECVDFFLGAKLELGVHHHAEKEALHGRDDLVYSVSYLIQGSETKGRTYGISTGGVQSTGSPKNDVIPLGVHFGAITGLE